MSPPSSQINRHLNKAPIKIQSLSLLIGFGSDRQPECQCLFQFHILATLCQDRLWDPPVSLGIWRGVPLAAWAERPQEFGSENPKQLPSDFTWGFSPSLPHTSRHLSRLIESLCFVVQVKTLGHDLGRLVKVPLCVTEPGLKKRTSDLVWVPSV